MRICRSAPQAAAPCSNMAGPGAQAARGTKEAYEIKLSALTLKRLDFSQSCTKCTSRYTVRAYMLKFNSLISRARFLSKFLPFTFAMSTRVSVCHLVRVSLFSRWVLVHHVADSFSQLGVSKQTSGEPKTSGEHGHAPQAQPGCKPPTSTVIC